MFPRTSAFLANICSGFPPRARIISLIVSSLLLIVDGASSSFLPNCQPVRCMNAPEFVNAETLNVMVRIWQVSHKIVDVGLLHALTSYQEATRLWNYLGIIANKKKKKG